ncbi:MAG TPA: STAS domain-containing protein [Solirubrobacteraceae bacterium]|nr:STAS domain-containing protein [Solirubrobacteraceae bacterium]
MSSFYISDDVICDDVVVVTAGGELDYEASPKLRERFTSLVKAGRRRLVLDLSTATFIDSTAIGVLVGAVRKLEEAGGGGGGGGGSFAVVCTHERVLQIFEISGLDGLITVYGSREQALASPAMAG